MDKTPDEQTQKADQEFRQLWAKTVTKYQRTLNVGISYERGGILPYTYWTKSSEQEKQKANEILSKNN